MRKLSLFIALAIVFCLKSFAGDLKVVEGDKKFMKTLEGNAVLVFDWENATYDNKMPLSEYFKDLEVLKNVAYNGFVEVFNEKSKKVKVVEDEADAQYLFSMKVDNMDRYIKVTGFIPGPATKVWGTMTVSVIATGEVLAVINVKEVNGGANPSPDGSFSDCFEDLAKQMVKLK